MSAQQIQKALDVHKSAKRALANQRFIKSEKGQYAHGDIFIGVSVPKQRLVAKRFCNTTHVELETLIQSKIHEYRFTALVILILQMKKADSKQTLKIFSFYKKHIAHVNNWDLVDVSAPHIVGRYLIDKDRKILYTWAKSKDLWKNRIAMVTTWWFIRHGQIDDTYTLADILLEHEHDLIHKAVGWMLRESGKRDIQRLEDYIRENVHIMPRTTLRYAIEKFEETKRKALLRL